VHFHFDVECGVEFVFAGQDVRHHLRDLDLVQVVLIGQVFAEGCLAAHGWPKHCEPKVDGAVVRQGLAVV